ncbi:MAG: hypothetical protein WD069_15755 [Planctomycetales bacterium]
MAGIIARGASQGNRPRDFIAAHRRPSGDSPSLALRASVDPAYRNFSRGAIAPRKKIRATCSLYMEGAREQRHAQAASQTQIVSRKQIAREITRSSPSRKAKKSRVDTTPARPRKAKKSRLDTPRPAFRRVSPSPRGSPRKCLPT